jgi:hypothetical protein
MLPAPCAAQSASGTEMYPTPAIVEDHGRRHLAINVALPESSSEPSFNQKTYRFTGNAFSSTPTTPPASRHRSATGLMGTMFILVAVVADKCLECRFSAISAPLAPAPGTSSVPLLDRPPPPAAPALPTVFPLDRPPPRPPSPDGLPAAAKSSSRRLSRLRHSAALARACSSLSSSDCLVADLLRKQGKQQQRRGRKEDVIRSVIAQTFPVNECVRMARK